MPKGKSKCRSIKYAVVYYYNNRGIEVKKLLSVLLKLKKSKKKTFKFQDPAKMLLLFYSRYE